MSGAKKELLSEIVSKAGCIYISDLSLPKNKTAVVAAVKLIEEKDYTLQEWKDAIHYIFGKKVEIDNLEQVKDILNS